VLNWQASNLITAQSLSTAECPVCANCDTVPAAIEGIADPVDGSLFEIVIEVPAGSLPGCTTGVQCQRCRQIALNARCKCSVVRSMGTADDHIAHIWWFAVFLQWRCLRV